MMSTVQTYLGNSGLYTCSKMILLEIFGFTLAIRRCMGNFVTIRRMKTDQKGKVRF